MTLKNHLLTTAALSALMMGAALAQAPAPTQRRGLFQRGAPAPAAAAQEEAAPDNAPDADAPPAVRPAVRPALPAARTAAQPAALPAARAAANALPAEGLDADPLPGDDAPAPRAPIVPVPGGARPRILPGAAVNPAVNAAADANAADEEDEEDGDALDAPVVRPGATNVRPGATTTGPGSTAVRPGSTAIRPGLTVPPRRTGIGADDDTTASTKASSKTNALKFSEAPLEIVLATYSSLTKRMPIVDQDVPKPTITLKSLDDVELTKEEMVYAIEMILSMNGITLEPVEEKFVKVHARKSVRSTGSPVIPTRPVKLDPETGDPLLDADGKAILKLHPETGKTISQMITPQHIPASEAQKALEGFKKPDGLFQVLERANTILVTDTQENINRMMEIIDIIDKPVPVEEEVFVRMINYAKAEDIKKRLDEFVAESQKQNQPKEELRLSQSGRPGVERVNPTAAPTPQRNVPPGLVRPPITPAPVTPNESLNAPSEADRGMIRGKVHIMADERTNKLIITTREDNMKFFNNIIETLDIETAPDIGVEVQRLEYADADEVATKLNDLIGNTTASTATRPGGGANPAAPGTTRQPGGGPGTSAPDAAPGGATGGGRGTLAETIAARMSANAAANANAPAGESKIGQLSKDNIKILSDKRTNAIIMMASKSDLLALKKIISSMDIQLAQVEIEVVIVQVKLGSGLNTGIDWVLGKEANNYTMRNGKDLMAGGGGSGTSLLGNLTGIASPSGSASGTNEVAAIASHVLSQGINYFLRSDKLNISALIQAAATDSRAKVLASPALLTVDNKEASIEVTEMRYLYKGVRYSGSYNYGNEVPDYEQRDIGLSVKITPRINPNGTVILTIDEKFETIGADQDVGGQKYPTINTHKLQADVSLENMQTVVLGGLVQSESTKSEGGIPILKDIPWIGRWLFGSVRDTEARSELLVFVTPQVFVDGAAASASALHRKSVLSDPRPWDDGGWSISPLADPVSAKIRLDRQARAWEDADQEYKIERELEKGIEKRSKDMMERAKKEAEAAAKKQKNARPSDLTPPAPTAPTVRVGGEGVKVAYPEDGESGLDALLKSLE